MNFTVILFFPACSDDEKEETVRKIIILYTNDEHGWMEESEETDGAAKLMGVWREVEEYDEKGHFLILSGGDNWTGPAISTWFKGESMVEVMNAMEYDAAAIGNHEFDFKVDGLMDRIDQADFPYLSANIQEKATGEMVDFALPYIVKEVNGVMVGLIGLTTTSTPYSTFPDYVADYNFISYAEALTEIVPQVKEDGAELLIVVGHICYYEMQALVPTAVELGISIIGGGHCNDLVAVTIDGVTIIEGGSYMQSYARVELLFDIEDDSIVEINPSTHENTGGTPDPDVENIVSFWRTLADAELSEVIGYVNEEIYYRSNAMYNLVTDSWLYSHPSADISATNIGGIRQSIPAGDITKGTIIGVLPFQNQIIQLELTGEQLIDCTGYLIVGGMTRINGYFLTDGTPIHTDTVYSVLTTDYLYARSDINFHLYDTDPYYTGMNYHQPTLDYIFSFNTSTDNPLDNYLDHTPRQWGLMVNSDWDNMLETFITD